MKRHVSLVPFSIVIVVYSYKLDVIRRPMVGMNDSPKANPFRRHRGSVTKVVQIPPLAKNLNRRFDLETRRALL